MTSPVIDREHIGVIRIQPLVRDIAPVRPARTIGCRKWFKVLPPLAQGLGDLEGFL